MDFCNITRDVWIPNENELLQQLRENHWDHIPLLNVNDVQNLKDKQLVKFRGMVQDMFNPVYYYEQYEIINTQTNETFIRNGRYSDFIDNKETESINPDSEHTVSKQRQTFVIISIPALNNWVHNIEKEKYMLTPDSIPSTSKTQKRPLEEEDMEIETTSINETKSENKKQCTITSSNTKESLSPKHLLNFPITERSGKACHVMLYDSAEKLKLNDLIEVVGFLSLDPVLTGYNSESEEDNEMEMQTHNPPPSLIPRIHCVAFRQIKHCNRLLDINKLEVDRMQYIKKELHMLLTQLLMGDALTAEYLIYHLISRVYIRNDLLPLGKFSMNITKIPVSLIPGFGKCLYEFLELMVPTSHYLEMTLENMNGLNFVPKKDYDYDRLTSGLLQLSNNTHLVLDETKLSNGRLNESGIKALMAVNNAIKLQQITYDFSYYPVEFQCDIAFLVLSEGKSLCSSDFHICLKPDETYIVTYEEILKAAKVFLNPSLLNDIRIYLTQARFANYDLGDDLQELIQNEFVLMRQTKSATADDLHQLLVLARLVCLSEGKSCLDADSWKKACELEKERVKRNC